MSKLDEFADLFKNKKIADSINSRKDPVIVNCLNQGAEAVRIMHMQANARVNNHLMLVGRKQPELNIKNRMDEVLASMASDYARDLESCACSLPEPPRIGRPKRNSKKAKAQKKARRKNRK